MQLKIQVQSRELSKDECRILAEITKSAREGTPLESDMTAETIAKNIERLSKNDEFHVLIASDEGGTLVGWTYYYVAFPLMAFISGFYPTVSDEHESEEITLSLIEASKNHILELGQHSRLEIEIEFPTEAHREYYKKLVELYQKCGFRFAAEEIHMKSDLSTIELPELDLPPGYVVRKFSDVPFETLEGPGYQSLRDSKEGLFLSLSPAEQKVTLEYFFSKSNPYIEDASLLLERENEIVGYVITRLKDDEPEIGPVGLVPDARGKGLASYLLVRVLENLKNSGLMNACLDTTITNDPAQKLYRRYGFEDVYYKQFYYWSP